MAHRTAVDDFRRDLLFGESNTLSLPICGNIRAGIMRLVRPYKDAPEAVMKAYAADLKVYEKMVSEQRPWDEIERTVNPEYFTDENAKTHKIKRKLTPQNVDYFTLRPCDCKTNPENAAIIHNLYDTEVEENGKKVKRLVRIPILLISSDWFECIPHALEYRKANTTVCHSEYKEVEENGRIKYKRTCVAPIEYEKGRKPWGGREWQELRNCDPSTCEDYQEERCKLSGFIYGLIPGEGIKGAGVWRIHSRSFYSFRQMATQLIMIGKIANGRIENLKDRKTGKPAIWIYKAADEDVTMWDKKKGEIKKREQDLIYLETVMTIDELGKQNSPEALRAYGLRAQALLSGKPMPELAAAPRDVDDSLSEDARDGLDATVGDDGMDVIDVTTETGKGPEPTLREDQIESEEYKALPPEERQKRIEVVKNKIREKRALTPPGLLDKYSVEHKVYNTSSLLGFETYLNGLQALVSLPV